MFWVVIIVICMICSAFFESLLGKNCSMFYHHGDRIFAFAMDYRRGIFITLAKTCAIIIVVAFMLASLAALIG